jgi:hypothetical protein
MKRYSFLWVFILILTSCRVAKPLQEIDPIQLHDLYEEEYCEKFVPDAYHPIHFDSGNEESDLDKKRQELTKLRDYNLISEEEFEQKIKCINDSVSQE